MTPHDLLQIRFVSDPQLSPDGRRVAFVVTLLSEDRDEYLSAIWIVDVAGGSLTRFTHGPLRDTAPRWSPDGRRLAFLSERDVPKGRKPRPQLYVMPADGGEALRLTDRVHGVESPVWSPDGARLCFVAKVGGGPEPEDEAERLRSKPARVITTLKYKWNGEGFVYDRRPHLFVVAADGGTPRQLTEGDFVDEHPVWSPDGRLLAFTSARHAEREFDQAADVWVVPAEGGEPRRVTATAGPVSHPVFAPDGHALAYLGHPYPTDVSRNMRLYTIPLDGGKPRCLTADLDRTCQPFFSAVGPHWASDDFIRFAVEDQGDVSVYRVRADGSAAPERILEGERQVTGLSVSGDGGRCAFAAMDPVAPAEVFVAAGDGRDERRLTDLNGAWRAEVALARPERFRFERDGLTVDGWFMRPLGVPAGARVPALLNIHGGPATQYGHAFFDEFQVYAGAGYAVLYVNPRGSQGYGEAFARAVVGDWGGGDYADVMAGLDAALARYDVVDPGRLGVMGGSYGGFLTSWIVGHTDRFRAACSERALNTHVSMVGTSDIGHCFVDAHSGRPPVWEEPTWYVERSPLTYARQIQTPLLIIHSEDDLRCPMEQAEQLFVALRRQQKEVVLVRFPDENHDLSRTGRPRHRLERFRIILEWFGRHLQPGGPGPA
jgi:dipeptidyl aminopeptidase/acylaminoacyl peptidase